MKSSGNWYQLRQQIPVSRHRRSNFGSLVYWGHNVHGPETGKLSNEKYGTENVKKLMRSLKSQSAAQCVTNIKKNDETHTVDLRESWKYSISQYFISSS